jgi:hypothetical protein
LAENDDLQNKIKSLKVLEIKTLMLNQIKMEGGRNDLAFLRKLSNADHEWMRGW